MCLPVSRCLEAHLRSDATDETAIAEGGPKLPCGLPAGAVSGTWFAAQAPLIHGVLRKDGDLDISHQSLRDLVRPDPVCA